MKAALVRDVYSAAHSICKVWDVNFRCSVLIGECLVVGQSHFKTFDNKFFTFTGRCQYLLARDCTDSEFSVIIENVQVIEIFFFIKL